MDMNYTRHWHWQDFISTYRFWGLVLASFLMTLSSSAYSTNLYSYLRDTNVLGAAEFAIIFGIGIVGSILAMLGVIYFLRYKLKLALIIFAGTTALATLLFFWAPPQNMKLMAVLQIFIRFGTTGFMIAAIATLVSGRPDVKSFVITFVTIYFWQIAGELLGPSFGNPALNFDETAHWFSAVPACLAVLSLLPMSGRMFLQDPDVQIRERTPIARNPVATFFLCAFIPFYILYWLSVRPGELKSLRTPVRQISKGGIIATAIFAPFILPIWFHDVREGFQDQLPGRSPKFLGFVAFLMPAAAAAMSQSDDQLLQKV